MADGFNIEGLDDLMSRLRQMGDMGKEVEEKALKKGAEIMRDALESSVPVSARTSNHARDHIVIGEIEDGKIPIGPDKKHFYLQFPEFGTSKQPAQGFMERAFNDSKDEAQRAVAEVLKEELGL